MTKAMSLTPGREVFAVELAKGAKQADAYRLAFPKSANWKPETVWSKASTLAKDGKVRARIAEIRGRVSDTLEISVERVLKERARLAFFDARKLLNDNGEPKGLHELDDDTAAAIAGLDTATERSRSKGADEDVDETTYIRKYKLADKNASLTALEKHLGMYAPDEKGEGALSIHIHL